LRLGRSARALHKAIGMRRKSILSQADEAEVEADGGENGVGGIAGGTREKAAIEMTLGLHVSDHSFDGGATSELALDGAEQAAFLTGDEDAMRVGSVVVTDKHHRIYNYYREKKYNDAQIKCSNRSYEARLFHSFLRASRFSISHNVTGWITI
jgi:hypothetical protein